MVQFLSINFFSWISSIFVTFFKSSRFFVSLCIRHRCTIGVYSALMLRMFAVPRTGRDDAEFNDEQCCEQNGKEFLYKEILHVEGKQTSFSLLCISKRMCVTTVRSAVCHITKASLYIHPSD